MKTEAPPVSRPWNLEAWSLRWKVTAVLAIPLTVAMVLGGLRVQAELTRAVQFSNAADQVVSVPDIAKLGNDFGLASAGYSAGALMPEDIEGLKNSINRVRVATQNSELPPEIVDRLNAAVVTIESVLEEIESKAPVRPDLPGQTAAVRADLADVIDEIIAPIEDPAVINAHARLVDAGNAQRRLADQVTGALAVIKDPNAPLTDLITASGAEIAMIDSLARSYPDASPRLDALRDAVYTRLDLIEAAHGGPLPILELRASLVDSVAAYTTLEAQAAATITDTVDARADETRTAALRDAAIVLATLLLALVFALLVSRSLVGPIRRLRFGALKVARHDLPEAIERVKAGDIDAVNDFEPVPVYTVEEIGQLARAVDDIHGQALKLAGEQASLRLQIGDMFETLARRSKSLVDQQLTLIENLEFEEKDPKRLESLFRLDHLAARMRRNGDNLLILSGTQTRRLHTGPVQLGDVVRAAMSEVEDYQRVQVGSTPQGSLDGALATDVVHLLAELVDNSLRASPPDTRVRISFTRAVDGGVLVEVTDRGIGIPDANLAEINERLASGGQVGTETARHMGLFVVSRLALRHGLTVRLRHTHGLGGDQGITASVHLPSGLLHYTSDVELTGPQQRVDTGGLPRVTVVNSGQMPQLVADPTPSAPYRLAPEPEVAAPTAAPEVPVPAIPVSVTSSLPQRVPGSVAGLPQRTPGATPGLPQRSPGANGAPSVAESVAEVPVPLPAPTEPVHPDSDQQLPTSMRHRYRTGAARSAAFFQNRPTTTPTPDARQDVTTTGTPIFSGMVSDWLADPTDTAGGLHDWAAPGDAGWAAAERVSEAPVESRTEAGLPQRTPGRRLVPGGVDSVQAAPPARLRDPEAVRENLSRHQRGTREGRAAGTVERNSNGGDS